jgi:mannose-6-phosphate isomerase-like protein (cupin superfamily)
VSSKKPKQPRNRPVANHRADRRAVLLSAGAASVASVGLFSRAHGLAPPERESPRDTFRNDPDHSGLTHFVGVHEGKGAIDIKFFFRDDRASNPALLLIYNIPPGASEGVHTHHRGDTVMGSFDEFYYILSGSGEMEIEGKRVPVTAGDHIFTPNGISHGIENTSPEGDLKVYLVAMRRE